MAAMILSVLNLLVIILLVIKLRRYQKVQKELLKGEEVSDLEAIVLKHKKTLATHNKNLKEIGNILEELVEKNKFNIQKVGVVRFNPFADTGGNMSFVIALLDGKNNGIVISSLHSREGTRIYAKPVENGQSQFNLTEEEKRAILQTDH